MWSATLIFRRHEEHTLIIDYFCVTFANVIYHRMAIIFIPISNELIFFGPSLAAIVAKSHFYVKSSNCLISNTAPKNSKSVFY